MDGENNGSGKPYEQMDDLGGFSHPYFWFNTLIWLKLSRIFGAVNLEVPSDSQDGALLGRLQVS